MARWAPPSGQKEQERSVIAWPKRPLMEWSDRAPPLAELAGEVRAFSLTCVTGHPYRTTSSVGLQA